MNYNIVTATRSVLRQYANFSGRATRSEFWWFYLAYTLVLVALNLVLGEENLVAPLCSLALLLPSLAVGVRRLHDTGRSGWNLLWCLLPLVGAIILLVFNCQDSQTGTNQYGESEKYPDTL